MTKTTKTKTTMTTTTRTRTRTNEPGGVSGSAVAEALACLRASHERARAAVGPLVEGSGSGERVLVREAAEELVAAVGLLDARLDQLERAGDGVAGSVAVVRVAEALASLGGALAKFASRRVPVVGGLFARLAVDYRLVVTRLLGGVVVEGGGLVTLEGGAFRCDSLGGSGRSAPAGRCCREGRSFFEHPVACGGLVPVCP